MTSPLEYPSNERILTYLSPSLRLMQASILDPVLGLDQACALRALPWTLDRADQDTFVCCSALQALRASVACSRSHLHSDVVVASSVCKKAARNSARTGSVSHIHPDADALAGTALLIPFSVLFCSAQGSMLALISVRCIGRQIQQADVSVVRCRTAKLRWQSRCCGGFYSLSVMARRRI
jgi:hypothetical protein